MSPRSPWVLALSMQAILIQASWFGGRLMIGYRAIAEGHDAVFLGLLAAALAAPALACSLPIGRLSDRWGGSVVAVIGIALVIVGTGIAVPFAGGGVLVLSAATVGLGNAAAMIGQQTFVAHRTTRHISSDNAFGNLSAAASIGQLIGPPLVTTVATLGIIGGGFSANTTAGLLAAIVCALLAAPWAIKLHRADRQQASDIRHPVDGQTTLAILATPGLWRSLVVSGCILVTVDLTYAFIPVWATEHRVSVVVVGWLLALRAFVSVVSRFGLSWMVARFGRKWLLLAAMAVGVISLGAFPAVDQYGAIAIMIGLGICLGVPQPLTLAWVVGITPPSQHGAVLGMRMTANRLAQVGLPLAITVIGAPAGSLGVFWGNAALLFASSVLVSRSNPDPPRAQSRS